MNRNVLSSITMLFAITMVAPKAPAAISTGYIGTPTVTTEPVLVAEPVPVNYDPALGVIVQYGDELTLRVSYKCAPGTDTNTLYRKTGDGAYIVDRELEDCSGVLTVADVEPAVQHCYKLESINDGARYSDQDCVTPKYLRVGFRNTLISPDESDRVLDEFDWHRTDPLLENYSGDHEFADLPILYHMNILIDEESKVEQLRNLGIHIQSDPIFMEELSGWNSGLALATHDGSIEGRWYFALVPGAVYNALRQASIDSMDAGDKLPIIAAAFRTLPMADAQSYGSDKHAASYSYLGQNGLEYNGKSGQDGTTRECEILEGQEVCYSPLIGWGLRKVVEYIDDGLDWVVDRARQGIGLFYTAIEGEASLSIQFRLLNTDPLFIGDANTAMRSAWRGNELVAAGMQVHVHQGLGGFFAKTDTEGRVTLSVAKGRNTKICLQAENKVAKLTELVGRTVVCFDNIGEVNGDRGVTVNIEHDYFNVLAQMTDADDYVQTVLGHNMGKITVLVGSVADRLAAEGAFAPCMGRLPGLVGVVGDLLPILSIAEFLYSVDIVMPSNSTKSRGVGTHEYGHVVMCDMLAEQGAIDAIQAWNGVVLDSLQQKEDSERRYIAEGFADFITSQVVGGTNYFTPDPDLDERIGDEPDNFYLSELAIHYCKASDSECLDYNFTDSDTEGAYGSTFRAQVRRVASVLHDVFDNNYGSAIVGLYDDGTTGYGGWSKPNDGSHWDRDADGDPLQLSLGNFSNTGDEMIELNGSDILTIFANWAKRGDSLSEKNFLGAVVDTLRQRDVADSEICELFRLHSDTGDCPAYAAETGTAYSTIGGTPVTALDSDLDGVPDESDNCVNDANENQQDTDGDGFGNWCDANFDQSDVVNFADMAYFRSVFGTDDPHADLDGSGIVNFADMARFKAQAKKYR